MATWKARFRLHVCVGHAISAMRGSFLLIFALNKLNVHFRSSWPTDLESVSRDAHLAVTVCTKFEVDTTIRFLVIALLLLISYVTLWPWPLTFWLWSVVIHGGSRDQPLHEVWRYYGYPFLSYELWVLTSPIGYHWQERAGHLEARFQGEGVVHLPIYWYHSKGNWMLYNFAADIFYETLQQTFRPLLSKSSKRRQI